jgi:hypothetical protein
MKYDNYNIIPIGDHCAISMILKELKFRKCSYPFDWVSHREQLHNTNIMYNIQTICDLVASNNPATVSNTYIGNAFQNTDKINSENNIWFPHDTEAVSTIISKYERRFERLLSHLFDKNVFILLTRHFYIEQASFAQIIEKLLSTNPESVVLFISGTEHTYIMSEYIGKNVVFKHIPYDISQFYDYDYSDFRPQIKKYLAEFFA